MYKATAILSVRLSVRMSGTLELGFRGSRAFPIAGAKVWNSLPDDVTSAPSLSTFRRHCLIRLVLTLCIVVLVVALLLLGHSNNFSDDDDDDDDEFMHTMTAAVDRVSTFSDGKGIF